MEYRVKLMTDTLTIVISGGSLAGVLTALGFVIRTTRYMSKVESTANQANQRVEKMDKYGSIPVQKFIAGFEEWKEAIELREEQRSRRLDAMKKAMDTLSNALRDTLVNHGERIVKVETKLNERGG